MTPGEFGSSDEELGASPPPHMHNLEAMRSLHTPEPVSSPPVFNHNSQARPTSKPYHSPELRRANSRLSSSTLAQMATAGGMGNPNDGGRPSYSRDGEDGVFPGTAVYSHDPSLGTYTNYGNPREGPNPGNQERSPAKNLPPPALQIPNQQSRGPMGPPSPYGQNPNSRPGTSEGRRSPYPPGQGPPRSPNPQQQGFRPDQTRPPPGPGGPPGPYGRGRPPPGQGPPPNGPPGQYGNYRPGPGGPPPPSGPGGRGGPPPGHPHRKPVPRQTNSITPDHIIDHYTSDGYRGGPPPGYDRRPPPPPHMQGPGSVGPNGNNDEERPRAGVMKTVGGGEPPMQRNQEFDMPEVNFGPTINYAASNVPRKHVPGPAEPAMRSQPQGYYSSEPQPYAQAPRSGHGRQESVGSGQRMAWQPAGTYTTSASGSGPGQGSQARALTPEQYVQHRAAANSPQYGANLAAGGQGGMGPRTPSPQALYPGAGRGGAGPPPPPHGGPGGSFSRPLGPPSPGIPPQRPYGAGQAPNQAPYQGQAF